MIKSIALLGNGGSISEGSFVRGVNSISLLKEDKIKLVSEYLNLHVQGDYINVNVIYQLENLGEAKNIKYGFAVDFRDNQTYNFRWEHDYIQNFTIINNGEELKTTEKEESNVRTEECDYSKYDVLPGVDTISRKWYISNLFFDVKETKQLIVSYRIKTNYADWGVQYPDENYYPASLSNRIFRYYLKPSGFWGNGSVDRFFLSVSFDNIDKYSYIEFSGIQGFKKKGNTYVYESSNFDLLKNEYLKFDYNYSKWLSTKNAISYNNATNLIKDIKSSTQHNRYPISNLIDNNKNTSYVPLKSEHNWIEVIFRDSVKVFGIAMINGYSKSIATYRHNNIVTKLKITIVFSNDTVEKYIDIKRKPFNSDYSVYFVGIEDFLWGDLFDDFYDIEGNYGRAISMKIEIIETDRGEKYDDTYISEIMIYGEKY